MFPKVVEGSEFSASTVWTEPLPYKDFVNKLTIAEMSNSIRSFATLRGLNYHELSHCLYSPSVNSSVRKSVLNIGADRIYHNGEKGQLFVLDLLGYKSLVTQNGKLAPNSNWFADFSKNHPKEYAEFNSAWGIAVSTEFWHKAWNTLEDQRIESLFVTKFPSARHFFTSAVLKYITKWKPDGKDEKRAGAAYLLLHGRRYLSKSLRIKWRELLQEEYGLDDATVTDVESLIDQYRDISSFKSQAESATATELVFNFGCWILKNIQDVSQIPEPEGGFDHDKHGKGGSKNTESKRDTEEIQDNRKEQEEEWDSQDEDSYGDSDSDDSDDDSEGDSHQDSDEDDSGDDDSDEDAFDGDGDSDGSEDDSGESSSRSNSTARNSESKATSESGSGTKASAGDSTTANSELRELLNQSENAIAEDALRQIQTLHETVNKNRFSRFFDNLHKPDSIITTPVLYRSLANAISTSLVKLRSDRDNQWEKGSSVGVVNVLRYAEARGTHTDFFDEWQEDGDERPDAEIVVLLDLSGSMNTSSWRNIKAYHSGTPSSQQPATIDSAFGANMSNAGVNSNAYEASCAMWAIKYACQRNDIPCSVIGYSDTSFALYGADDTVASGTTPVFGGISGTQPKDALHYARNILERSDAKHKILVSLSDGDWSITAEGLAQVDAIKKFGGQTVFIQLPSNAECKYFAGDGTTRLEKPIVTPVFSQQGANAPKQKKGEYYHHEHHLRVEDAQALTKHIGAILLKAVAQ